MSASCDLYEATLMATQMMERVLARHWMPVATEERLRQDSP
jgi:phenylpropionate dioxygenase-like ring-hydroxylating dioxygenase large terminal subunit